MGKQLRVDVELADPPRDELGELAAEVEDDDGVGLRSARLAAGDGAAGDIQAGASRRRGVERDLEVRLHLGVVGGEDTVPRVGELAVDRLAPPARGLLVVVPTRRAGPGRRPVGPCASAIRRPLLRLAQSASSWHPRVATAADTGSVRGRRDGVR